MSFLIPAPNRVMPAELAERPRSTGRKSPTRSVRRGADRGRLAAVPQLGALRRRLLRRLQMQSAALEDYHNLSNYLRELYQMPATNQSQHKISPTHISSIEGDRGYGTAVGSRASTRAGARSERLRQHSAMGRREDARAISRYCRISTIGSALGGKRSQVVASLSEKRQMPPRPMSTSSA
jgi:hypothetical protein